MPGTDAEILLVLEDLFDRFKLLVDHGQDARDVVQRMIEVADSAVQPGHWRETLADELFDHLQFAAPTADDEWTATALSCLDAVCEFVRIAPCPDLASALVVRATATPGEQNAEDLNWIIEHADQVSRETVTDAFLERARSRSKSDLRGSIDDWIAAAGMVTTTSDQIGCAVSLAVAYAELEQPLEEADWSWQAAVLVEIDEPSSDLELLQEAYAAQFRGVEHVQRIDGPARQMRPLVDRMLSRPGWAPEEVLPPHVHIMAAAVCIQDNDAAAALTHLTLAEHRLGEVDVYFRAQWQLSQMECAVLRSDSITAEYFARRAWLLIEDADDEEQRTRFRHVVAALGTVTGPWDFPGEDLAAVRMLGSVLTRLRAGAGGPDEIEQLDRAIQAFDPLMQAHLVVTAYALRARINGVLGRIGDAGADLRIGRAMLAEIEADPPGGFPRGVSTFLEQSEVMLEAARGRPEAAAERMDEIWRAEFGAGAHSAAIGTALAAAELWLSKASSPRRAVASALAALTIAQEFRYTKGDSKDRSAVAAYVRTGNALAVEAVSAMGDCALMAELLEVMRAQTVPYVSDDPGVATGPLASMLSDALGDIPDPGDERRTSAVLLSPPPLIVMPWGSVAMAPWLQYDKSIERRVGRMVLADV